MLSRAVILLCVVFVLALSVWYIHDHYVGNKNIEVIISRYNEDLKWLQEPEFDNVKITVYNKGPTTPNTYGRQCRVINLPNVGRCDHTYLYHIISNYGNLSDVTVFLPGSCFDKHKGCVTLQLLHNVYKTGNTVLPNLFGTTGDVRRDSYDFVLDKWKATNLENNSINSEKTLQKSPIRPFGAWFDRNFPNHPIFHVVCYYGMFAISKEHIAQHPVSRFENLIQYVDSHSNPEAGHYMERSWGAVFYPYPESCVVDVDRC